MREMVLRAGASASTVGSSSEAAAANTESRGPMSGMGSSGGGPQRSGLLSLGAAAAAARGRGSAGSSSATPRPRFAAHATPAPEDEGTIQALCACVRAAAGDEGRAVWLIVPPGSGPDDGLNYITINNGNQAKNLRLDASNVLYLNEKSPTKH